MTHLIKLIFSIRVWTFVLLLFFCLFISAIAQEPNTGQNLYHSLCSSCHGTDLRGGLGPNLIDDEWLYGNDRDDLSRVIRDGTSGRNMPAFGNALSDEEISEIIDFISSVQENPERAAVTTADTLRTLDYAVDIEVFADSLEIPWAIDFLDPQTALITERPGRLRVVQNGRLIAKPVKDTPEVLVGDHEWNQGGLLDVTVDPNYQENGWIYLAYSHGQPDFTGRDTIPAMTRIVRGRIYENQWSDEEVLFEASPDRYNTNFWHYGGRIVFDPEGYLYFSVGDRGVKEQAQDLSRPNGKVYRINPDGSIPENNPFVDVPNALPSIFTYGHRNPQGLAVHPVTGDIWAVEHGPRGGDELNRLQAGRNYGWPVISYGINYDGTILTPHRRRTGLEQPARYWRPSIAVSGLAFYKADLFNLWRNKLLIGALAYEEVRLADIEGDRVMHEEVLLKDNGRVREAVTGPDGALYIVLNEPGRVIRMIPRKESIQ